MDLFHYSKLVFDKKAITFSSILNKAEVKKVLSSVETVDQRKAKEIRKSLAKRCRELAIAQGRCQALVDDIVKTNKLGAIDNPDLLIVKSLIKKLSSEKMTPLKQKALLTVIEKSPKIDRSFIIEQADTSSNSKVLRFLSRSKFKSVRTRVYLNKAIAKNVRKLMAKVEYNVDVLRIMATENKNPVEVANNKISDPSILSTVVHLNPGNAAAIKAAVNNEKTNNDVVLLAATVASTPQSAMVVNKSPYITKKAQLVLAAKPYPLVLDELSKSPHSGVRILVAKNSKITLSAKRRLAKDRDPDVLSTLLDTIQASDESSNSISLVVEVANSKHVDENFLINVLSKFKHPKVIIAVANNTHATERVHLLCVEAAKESGDEVRVLVEVVKSKYPKVRTAILGTGKLPDDVFKQVVNQSEKSVIEDLASNASLAVRKRLARFTKDEDIIIKCAGDEEPVQLEIVKRKISLPLAAEESLANGDTKVRLELAKRPKILSEEAEDTLINDNDPKVLVTFIKNNANVKNLREVAEKYEGNSLTVVNALAEEAKKRNAVRLQQDLIKDDKVYESYEAMVSMTAVDNSATRANFSKQVCIRFNKAKAERAKMAKDNPDQTTVGGDLLRYSRIVEILAKDSSRVVNREPKRIVKENVEIFARNA